MRIESFSPVHSDGVAALCAAEDWPSWTSEKVARAFAAPGVVALVAVDDDVVAGAAQLLSDGEVIAYLGLLVVARGFRRHGVAGDLIRELFVRSGLRRIDLLSETGATGFYESLPHKTKPGYRLYDS